MKKNFYSLATLSLVALLPTLALAAPQDDAAVATHDFVETLNEVILFPTISLLIALATIIFLWGAAKYFINSNNEQSRQEGAKSMTYGIIGLVVMISAYTILTIATNTVELGSELECADNPTGGCSSSVFDVSEF